MNPGNLKAAYVGLYIHACMFVCRIRVMFVVVY